MEKPKKEASRPEFFYGWIIAFSLLVIYFLADGISLTVPPVLYPSLIEEFGLTEGAVSLCGAITLIVAGVAAPLAGMLLDRFGGRRMVHGGLLLLGLCGILYVQASALWHFYVLHAFLGLGLVFCGMLSLVVLVSNWFIERRSTVLGFVLAGSSLSGGILPNLLAPLVSDPLFGWRWAYGVVLGLLLVIALPLSLVLVKESPSDVGDHPDGKRPSKNRVESGKKDLPSQGVPFRQARGQFAFWVFAACLAALWFSVFAVHSQLIIFMKQDLGFTQELASFCFSLIFICSVTGNLVFSSLSDRLGKRRVIPFAALMLFLGSSILFDISSTADGLSLALTNDLARILLFAVLFGSGYGGTFTILQAMISDHFGPGELGRILGVLTLLGTMGGFAGISSSGFLRTWTGSYLIPFVVVSALCAIMVALLLFLKRLARKTL